MVSTPINSLLVEWLKKMKDSTGNSFVQKWGEGTKTIRESMKQLKLPSAEYTTSINSTAIALRNNYIEREAKINQLNSQTTELLTEYLNIFEIEVFDRKAKNKKIDLGRFLIENKIILKAISNKLISENWFIDRFSHSRIRAHRKNSCLLYTSPSPRDLSTSRMPSSA